MGSQGLGDASLRWMRYPCLISGVQLIQSPWDRVSFSLGWLWLSLHEAFPVPCEYCRTMHQYIVYIYLAYACDIACQYFIGHTTLKERAWTLETHGYSVPFKQSILSDECRVFLRIRMQRCLMPKTMGFRVPILLIICWMLGMGHPLFLCNLGPHSWLGSHWIDQTRQ